MKSALALALLAGGIVVPTSSAQAASAPDLTFATFNVCKMSCGTGQFAWSKRRHSVVRYIVASRPDVIGLQEVHDSYPWLAKRLARHGYAMLQPAHGNCDAGCIPDSQLFYRSASVTPVTVVLPKRMPSTEPCRTYVRTRGWAPYEAPTFPDFPPPPWPPALPPWDPTYASQYQAYQEAMAQWKATEKSLIDEYEAARAQHDALLRQWKRDVAAAQCQKYDYWWPNRYSGSISQAGLSGGRVAGVHNRNFAWGLFRDNRTKGVFLATSLHLPNEKTPAAEQYRVYLAQRMSSYLRERAGILGLHNVPSVVMGDLNSYVQRQPRGAQWVFARQGYRDAYSAKQRINMDVPTINVTKSQRNPWRSTPFRFDSPARLDYVMFNRGTALRYEVSLHLKNGRFDNRYRSSDHNLVAARLRLPLVLAR